MEKNLIFDEFGNCRLSEQIMERLEPYFEITDALYNCPYNQRETYLESARYFEIDMLDKAKSDEEESILINIFSDEQINREQMMDLNDADNQSFDF